MTGPRHAHLTPRETDLLRLMTEGYSNAEIAAKLGLASAKTVRDYQNRLYCLLGVSSRTEAVAVALNASFGAQE